MKELDVVKLTEDLNPEIKKGMLATILEVYDNGKDFEIECVNPDGTNIEYDGQSTFKVSEDYIKPVKSE